MPSVPSLPFGLPFRFADDVRSLAASAQELVGRLGKTDSDLERLNELLGPLVEELATVRGGVAELRAQMADTERQLGTVETQFASTEHQVASLEREIAGLETTVGALQADLQHVLDRVPGLKPADEREAPPANPSD